MWVKTRQEVALSIELSALTHELVVAQPNVSNAVVAVNVDGSVDGFSVNGRNDDLPLTVNTVPSRLLEVLMESNVNFPVQLVFSRVQGDISVKVAQANSVLSA